MPEWARKVRVGANSPSLWPTIDSETKTGTCLRPSWTAIVWPTISGKIVEVRDQVLTICLLPDSFIWLIRASRRSSTNGPFLVDRPISVPLLLPAAAAAHDQRVGGLALLARPVAERRLAPRGHRVAARGVVRLAAAVRMVDGVHRHAAGLRAAALVALAPRLAELDVLVLGVRERADGGAALGAHHPHLRRRQPQGDHRALLGDELDRGPGGAAEAAALARGRARRCGRRCRPGSRAAAARCRAGCRRRRRTRHGAGREPLRGEDVALLAVGVVRAGRRSSCGWGRTRSSRPWPGRRPCGA